MIQRLFGGDPRVLEPSGVQIRKEILDAHRTRHQAQPGERQAGQTANFTVFSDGTPNGDAAAQAVLQNCEADLAQIQQWFSGISLPTLPFMVYMDPNAGGAYHIGCGGVDIHVLPDPQRAPGFLVAEVVEVFEDTQDAGWNCGQTNGEALSRVLAFDRYPSLAPDFSPTETSWWQDGHQDYVNDNSAGDTDQDANGCGDLFLYYLHSQLNFAWSDVIAAGGQTLGETYMQLAGYDGGQGFSDFVADLTQIAPGGTLQVPASGNPFPISGGGGGANQ